MSDVHPLQGKALYFDQVFLRRYGAGDGATLKEWARDQYAARWTPDWRTSESAYVRAFLRAYEKEIKDHRCRAHLARIVDPDGPDDPRNRGRDMREANAIRLIRRVKT